MAVTEISCADLAAMMGREEDFVLLDVRSARAYGKSHLSGAISVPGDLSQVEFPPGTTYDTPIVVYCYIGVKSMQVAVYLDSIGFADVRSLRRGHLAWRFIGKGAAR